MPSTVTLPELTHRWLQESLGAISEKTLSIQGTGSLTAGSNGDGVGIGSADNSTCGNITISADLHVETSDEGRTWTLTPVAP